MQKWLQEKGFNKNGTYSGLVANKRRAQRPLSTSLHEETVPGTRANLILISLQNEDSIQANNVLKKKNLVL